MNDDWLTGFLWPLWVLAILGLIFLAIKLWHNWLALNIYQKITIVVTIVLIVAIIIQYYL